MMLFHRFFFFLGCGGDRGGSEAYFRWRCTSGFGIKSFNVLVQSSTSWIPCLNIQRSEIFITKVLHICSVILRPSLLLQSNLKYYVLACVASRKYWRFHQCVQGLIAGIYAAFGKCNVSLNCLLQDTTLHCVIMNSQFVICLSKITNIALLM